LSGASAARLAPLRKSAELVKFDSTEGTHAHHAGVYVPHTTSGRVVAISEVPRRLVCREARLVAVQQTALFHGLTVSECKEALAAATERRLARRDTLFREGEPVHHVSLLTSGRVKLTQLSSTGAEVILKLRRSGEVAGGLGMIAGAYHLSTAQALEPCEALLWELRTFDGLAERFPAVHRNAVRILAESLTNVEERFRELATEQVAPRLARMLVRLLDDIGRAVEGAISINLTREELAQMTGTTLFTVSRLLNGWEDLGLVGARREAVLVYDAEGLGDLAESA
jgi:CRP/FNR family transcriptional regulator, nitrogen oxide reductase regulator